MERALYMHDASVWRIALDRSIFSIVLLATLLGVSVTDIAGAAEQPVAPSRAGVMTAVSATDP